MGKLYMGLFAFRNARLNMFLALIAVSVLTSCSHGTPSDLEKLRSLPPADLSHPDLWDKIPYIVLTEKGACINHSKVPVPFDRLLNALANLPKSAWPCGRLIEFHDSPNMGLQSIKDEQKGPPASKAYEIETDLRAAGIEQIPLLST